MPYVSATPQNRSGSAPPLRILKSLSRSRLAPDHSVGKLLSVLPRQSSWSRIHRNTPVTQTTPAPQAFSSPVDKPSKSSLKPTRSSSNREASTSSVGRSILAAACKRVHFKDRDGQLESVHVFRATGRPSAIFNLHSDSDTGSETALSDDDSDNRAGPWRRQRASAAAAAALVPLEVANVTSQIPSPRTPLTCFVRLKSITPILTRFGQQPLLLHGIVHVRNIAYEKQVAVRYTLDDWETTSEIRACYAYPLPASPARRGAALPGAPIDPGNGAWDQFSFAIPLMLRAPPNDPPRTLLLAVRFTVPGKGEWWDNNGGDNFRIVLSQLPSAGRGAAEHGQLALGPPGLSLSSMWDVSFVKNAAAESPRKPLAVPCSANAQAEMAGALPSMMSWGTPIPTAPTNRQLPVA